PAAPEAPVRFRALLDGRPPGAASGGDVDAQGNGTIAQARLYQLIRQSGPVIDRTLPITLAHPGAPGLALTLRPLPSGRHIGPWRRVRAVSGRNSRSARWGHERCEGCGESGQLPA